MEKSRSNTDYSLFEALDLFRSKTNASLIETDMLREMRVEAQRNPDAHGARIFVGMFDQLNAVTEALQDRLERQQQLQSAIEKGRFIATGRLVDHRGKSADRVRIAADLFSVTAEIDWRQSRMCNAGLKFELVRVSPVSKYQKQASLPAYSEIKGTQRGRPSKETEILEIISELEQSGYQFNKSTRIKDIDAIRQRARNKYNLTKLKGYSEPVLSRILYRKFRIKNKKIIIKNAK